MRGLNLQTAKLILENDTRVQTFEKGTYQNDEADLVKRALQGSHEAFADLLRPHLKAVRAFVRHTVRNDFDADDVIQQTLLKAYSRLKQFRFQASFSTWLHSIARNEILQNVRRKSRSRLVFDEGKAISLMMSDSKDSPFELYARKEMLQELWQAVSKLPTKYRAIIELFISDKTLREAGSELSISGGATKSRYLRARRALRQLLTKSVKTNENRDGFPG